MFFNMKNVRGDNFTQFSRWEWETKRMVQILKLQTSLPLKSLVVNYLQLKGLSIFFIFIFTFVNYVTSYVSE
jgi:hypothetical protein